MDFRLPPLPYASTAYEPYISREVINTHYNIVTKGYCDRAIELIANTPAFACGTVEAAIDVLQIQPKYAKALAAVVNVYNHKLYWDNISPPNNSTISAELEKEIIITFGSVDEFKQQFIEAAMGVTQHDCNWTWLLSTNGKLSVRSSPSGMLVRPHTTKVLLAMDGWEHAYYQQYPANKLEYINAVWNVINWSCVNDRFARSHG